MTALLRVSDRLRDYLLAIINDLEVETNVRITFAQASDIVVNRLKGKDILLSISSKGLVNKRYKGELNSFWG